jgi:tetratricopeptide (TPR) repeat protein
LGLAAIATAQNREQDATQYYREILEREPRNATAQGALLDLTGGPDSLADESRLKTLIDREPSPHLYQTLANLYAEQQRWPEAQNAYFEAFRGAPGNADYAFNLAVSLDMLGQRAAALSFYEKAIALGGIHRFDRAQAEARIRHLKQAQ